MPKAAVSAHKAAAYATTTNSSLNFIVSWCETYGLLYKPHDVRKYTTNNASLLLTLSVKVITVLLTAIFPSACRDTSMIGSHFYDIRNPASHCVL